MATQYPANDILAIDIDPSNREVGWDNVRKACKNLTDWGLRLLCAGLDKHVKTVMVEPHYVCKDHRNLHSNFYSKKFVVATHNCSRMHFFSVSGIQPRDLFESKTATNECYIGYSVVRPVSERCLGRTVIDPAKIGRGYTDGYCSLRTKFDVRINGVKLQVTGYPYMSQDVDATVCAHSALWSVCRYLSERYSKYPEIYPYDLITMTEKGQGRTFPYRGMTYSDYCKILSDFGAFPVFRILQKRRANGETEWDSDAFMDLYSLVESGFPVLGSIHKASGRGHVVSIIGHTFDAKKTIGPSITEKMPFVDSSFFLKDFVIVDDNHFPYRLLEKDDQRDIAVITCPLPEKVFLRPEHARVKGRKAAEKAIEAIKKTGKGPYVTRLFIATGSAFKEKKLRQGNNRLSPDAAAMLVTRLHLPHFVWVMEVAPLEHYQRGKATCEIVLDPTAGVREDGIIYMRTGTKIALPMEGRTFSQSIPGATEEFELFAHNLGEKGG